MLAASFRSTGLVSNLVGGDDDDDQSIVSPDTDPNLPASDERRIYVRPMYPTCPGRSKERRSDSGRSCLGPGSRKAYRAFPVAHRLSRINILSRDCTLLRRSVVGPSTPLFHLFVFLSLFASTQYKQPLNKLAPKHDPHQKQNQGRKQQPEGEGEEEHRDARPC